MESETLRYLQKEYSTDEKQQARLSELIDSFGSLSDSHIKANVGDILCLASILYEANFIDILEHMKIQVLQLRIQHRDNKEYLQKLKYLEKCLTSFKPVIFQNLKIHFADLYDINPDWVICLPKVSGQQVGTKVEVKRSENDTNPIYFHVKTHQEFCSKSHPTYLVVTSDGTGYVDFKELFIYKVLEYIGYAPKTSFIVDMDVTQSRVEEGILIATQDLGYSKRPAERKKSFKLFSEAKDELNSQKTEEIDERTKKDIIAIDMLSRVFLLEDVMINHGNFAVVISQSRDEASSIPAKTKWKIIDFMAPPLRDEIGDNYLYAKHYPHAQDIFYSFKIGNASHSYNRPGLEVIHRVLMDENAKNLWLPVIDRLTQGKQNQMSVVEAVARAYSDIETFMRTNQERLQMKDERFVHRMADLELYKLSTLQNFNDLEAGVREALSKQLSDPQFRA